MIVCCESLVAAVECKTYWRQDEIEKHYTATVNVESKRCEKFQDKDLLSGYFLFFHEPATPQLASFKDADRTMGFYCLQSDQSWSSPFKQKDFTHTDAKVLETFFKDLLMHCMRIGQVEIGTFEYAYAVVSRYVGWQTEDNKRA